MNKRRYLPPWAMGLAVAPLGFYFGFISTAMPILLRARGVSLGQIAEVSGWGFSPSFWAFLLCPILDVHFTKRTYALFFAAVAAVCLGGCVLLTGNLPAFTAVLTLGCAAAVIFGNAHGGWMPDVVADKHYSAVGGTTNIANLGAAGVFAWVTVALMRALRTPVAALVLGLLVLAPVVLLFFIPPAPKPTRTAVEVFRSFFRDLWRVSKTRRSVLGLACFLSPTACFALTNLFSGMGSDFRVSEDWVTRINGPLVAVVCSLGCVAGVWFCNRVARRYVYVIAGFGGAAAALSLIWMPHLLGFYAAGVLVYNFFQGINYTAFTAFEYEIVGPGNPLSSTQMALLTAAANAPISYMTVVDGHFYATHGLAGMFLVDAGASVVVGAVLLGVFGWLRGRPEREMVEVAA